MRPLPNLPLCALGLSLALLAACRPVPPATGAATSSPPPVTQSPTSSPASPPLRPDQIFDFPEAESISVVADPAGALIVALGQGHSLFVARSADDGRTVSAPALATGDRTAHVLGLESPALAVNEAGRFGLAWLEIPPDFNGGQVWYAFSDDGGRTFTPGQLAATDRSGETTMVALALTNTGDPILAWLNGSRLRVVRSFDQGRTFQSAQNLDTGSCECCQPQVLVNGDNVYLAYRSLEPTPEAGDIRDIVLIRSLDGGQRFAPITRVSDAHWYLSACPIAGPSLAAFGQDLYVAWMDGRSAPPGTFSRGDVWLARSRDGGVHFSANVRVNPDESQHHTKPAIAVGPDGRLHIVWEVQGDAGAALYYARSDDGGLTAAAPRVIVSGADGAFGRPRMPMLTVTPTGQIAVAWIDQQGAHLGLWPGQN